MKSDIPSARSTAEVLAMDLKKSWRLGDFEKMNAVVRDFSSLRDQLVLDWMPAMLVHHCPDWRPGRSFRFRETDPSSLLAQFDIAQFALLTPLSQLYEEALKRKCGHGPLAMFVFERGERVLVPQLREALSEANDFRSQVQCFNSWFLRCVEAAADEVVWLFGSSVEMETLVAECAAFRFIRSAFLERDPSLYMASRQAPSVIAEELASAAVSGAAIVYRLADVFPVVARNYGVVVDDASIDRNLVTNRALGAMARLYIGDSEAMTRIVGGCDQSCYAGDAALVADGPHGGYLDAFDGLEDFHRRHWRYMWFDPAKFAMFGPTAEDALMGLALELGSSIDPSTGAAVEQSISTRPPLGCPALAYGGITDLVSLIGTFFRYPPVASTLKAAAETSVEATLSLNAVDDLKHRFSVRRMHAELVDEELVDEDGFAS